MDKYEVFVMADEAGMIVNINSSAFLEDTDDWIKIDEGSGDKYHHAQNNYLDKPLYEFTDGEIIYNYRLVGGRIAERTDTDEQVAPKFGAADI